MKRPHKYIALPDNYIELNSYSDLKSGVEFEEIQRKFYNSAIPSMKLSQK
jgi:hypothetical protein